MEGTQDCEDWLSPVRLQEKNIFSLCIPQSLTCKEFLFIFELFNPMKCFESQTHKIASGNALSSL